MGTAENGRERTFYYETGLRFNLHIQEEPSPFAELLILVAIEYKVFSGNIMAVILP